MSIRKYLGMGLGLILSAILATSAIAGSMGPSRLTNAGPGWNSPIWPQQSDGFVYFQEQYCVSTATSLQFDLMHHWPFTPSTGTNAQWMSCVNNSTWRWINWYAHGAGVDYSIEYTHNNTKNISLTYFITWPGN